MTNTMIIAEIVAKLIVIISILFLLYGCGGEPIPCTKPAKEIYNMTKLQYKHCKD